MVGSTSNDDHNTENDDFTATNITEQSSEAHDINTPHEISTASDAVSPVYHASSANTPLEIPASVNSHASLSGPTESIPHDTFSTSDQPTEYPAEQTVPGTDNYTYYNYSAQENYPAEQYPAQQYPAEQYPPQQYSPSEQQPYNTDYPNYQGAQQYPKYRQGSEYPAGEQYQQPPLAQAHNDQSRGRSPLFMPIVIGSIALSVILIVGIIAVLVLPKKSTQTTQNYNGNTTTRVQNNVPSTTHTSKSVVTPSHAKFIPGKSLSYTHFYCPHYNAADFTSTSLPALMLSRQSETYCFYTPSANNTNPALTISVFRDKSIRFAKSVFGNACQGTGSTCTLRDTTINGHPALLATQSIPQGGLYTMFIYLIVQPTHSSQGVFQVQLLTVQSVQRYNTSGVLRFANAFLP